MSKRECGECHACCVAIRVQSEPGDPVAVSKPPGVRCACLTNRGLCSVYEQRPSGCVAYTCSWLAGHGAENERPDKCGAVVELMEGVGNDLRLIVATPSPGFAKHSRSFREVVRRWEDERGAMVLSNDPKVLAKLKELRVVVRFPDGMTIDFRKIP